MRSMCKLDLDFSSFESVAMKRDSRLHLNFDERRQPVVTRRVVYPADLAGKLAGSEHDPRHLRRRRRWKQTCRTWASCPGPVLMLYQHQGEDWRSYRQTNER